MIDGPNDAAEQYYDYSSPGFALAEADWREQQKLDAYVSNPNGDARPWYERIAEYGFTRAIDANFGPAPTNKTSSGGTFAGQDGRTYSQVGSGQSSAPNAIGNYLPLIIAAGVALFALG